MGARSTSIHLAGRCDPLPAAPFLHRHRTRARTIRRLGREFARPEAAAIAQVSPKKTADAVAEVILPGLVAAR